MADNTTINSMSGGDVIATDDIAGVKYQRIKISWGVDGSAVDASDTNPLPVVDASITTILGEVQASPTANTLLARLKNIEGYTDGVETLLTAIDGHVDQIEGYIDGIETLLTTIDGHVDGVEGSLTTIAGAIKSEDAVHSSGDAGIMALSVANVAQTALAADGDYIPRAADLAGNSMVVGNVASAATDSGNPVKVAGKYNSSIPTFTDGQRGDLQLTARGALRVELGNGANAVNLKADNADAVAVSSTVQNLNVISRNTVFNGTSWDRMSGDTTGINVKAIVGALPAGTNAIGKLAANSGVDIGDVDVTSAVITGGAIAHDSADSGNPLKIGFKAYSPDGTTPGTAVAEGDRTDAKADLDGRQYVNTEAPRHWSYHEDSSSALTDATVQAAPGAGFEVVITEIIFSTGAATACNIFFEEGSTKVLGPWYLEAVAGRGLVWRGNKHITANTAVTVTTSAAIAHGLDIQGYIQAV